MILMLPGCATGLPGKKTKSEALKALWILLLAGVAGILFGCSQKARLNESDLKVFDGASPDLKQCWQTACAAAATNGYVETIVRLRVLMGENLSAAQRAGVEKAMTDIDARLMKAVNRGDPSAQKALETLQSPSTLLSR